MYSMYRDRIKTILDILCSACPVVGCRNTCDPHICAMTFNAVNIFHLYCYRSALIAMRTCWFSSRLEH